MVRRGKEMMPDGFMKINKHSLFGIEDGDGRTMLPTLYRLIKFSDTGDVITVQDNDYRYGLFDKEGKEIVPIGKYSFICKVERGFTRVKISKDEWGIIDQEGNEMLRNLNEIWGFNEAHDRFVVTKDGKRYTLSIAALEALQNSLKAGDNKVTADDVLSYHPKLQRKFSGIPLDTEKYW